MKPPSPSASVLAVQKLARWHNATVLTGACAARTAAELALAHGTTVPDDAIGRASAYFDALLRMAIGQLNEDEDC
jgi:hypothetical protein